MNGNIFGGADVGARATVPQHQFQLSRDFDSRVIDVNDLYINLNTINERVLKIINTFKEQINRWEKHLSLSLSSGVKHIRDYELMQKLTLVIDDNATCVRLLDDWYTDISEHINSCFENGLKYANLLSQLRNLCRNEITDFDFVVDEFSMAKSKMSKAKSIQSYRNRLYKLDNKINSTISTLQLQFDMFQRGFISLNGKTTNLNVFIDNMERLSASDASSLKFLRGLIVERINLQNIPIINYQTDNNIKLVLESLKKSLSGDLSIRTAPNLTTSPQPRPQNTTAPQNPIVPINLSATTTSQNAATTTQNIVPVEMEVDDMLMSRRDALMANIDLDVTSLPLTMPQDLNVSISEIQSNFISTQHNVKRLKKWYANIVNTITDNANLETLVDFVYNQIRSKTITRIIGDLRSMNAQSNDKSAYIVKLRNYLRFIEESVDSTIYQDLERMLRDVEAFDGDNPPPTQRSV